MKNKKGFTLIELIIVVALVTLLSSSVAPIAGQSILRVNWRVTQDRILSDLAKMQTYAMNGKNGQTWGVCMVGDVFRAFSGSCGSPTFKTDFKLPSSVSVSGLSTITFDKLRGEPTPATSTISVTSALGTATITVGPAGMIKKD